MKQRESTEQHWDKFWSSGNLDYINKITDELEKTSLPGKAILEIGAGSGSTSIVLAQMGGRVFCIDYSQNAVQLIKKNAVSAGAPVHCVKANAFALPFKEESFDICFHQGFLEHFREPEGLLSEQRRVLKTGGILLVDVPQAFSLYTVKKKLLIAIGKWFAGWEKEFTKWSLRKVLTRAGFSYCSAFGRYHFRNLDRIQKKLLGKSILPKSFETAFYRAISRLENSFVGCSTAFAIGMIVKKRGN
jgi:ubiquinone/menaquinone biosynthesis C-methylase UbiE